MNGDASIELVKEVRAVESSGALWAEFDHVRVRQVTQQIQQHQANLDSTLSNPYVNIEDPYFGSKAEYHKAAMLRSKRCLVAYFLWRTHRLNELWWGSREHLAMKDSSKSEKEYVSGLNNLYTEYMSSFTVPLDLRAFTCRPPISPGSQMAAVRGLKDYSIVSPSSGRPLNIYAGKQCSVCFEDAEMLLRQDVVELILEK